MFKLEEIHKFINYINSNKDVQEKLMEIELDEFPAFIKNMGYAFSVDDFIGYMQELDAKQYASNGELSDIELDNVSGGNNFIYRLLKRFKK